MSAILKVIHGTRKFDSVSQYAENLAYLPRALFILFAPTIFFFIGIVCITCSVAIPQLNNNYLLPLGGIAITIGIILDVVFELVIRKKIRAVKESSYEAKILEDIKYVLSPLKRQIMVEKENFKKTEK